MHLGRWPACDIDYASGANGIILVFLTEWGQRTIDKVFVCPVVETPGPVIADCVQPVLEQNASERRRYTCQVGGHWIHA